MRTYIKRTGRLTHAQLRRFDASGQGLAEYALIIALVALVAIGVLVGVGMAASRNYALVAGALGAQKNDSNASSSTTDAIDISQASCYVVTSLDQIQILVSINASANIKASDLSFSITDGFLNGPIVDSGSQTFSQTTIIYGTVDPARCPKSVVVQSKHATDIKQFTVQIF